MSNFNEAIEHRASRGILDKGNFVKREREKKAGII
jgi:hypothetical protein